MVDLLEGHMMADLLEDQLLGLLVLGNRCPNNLLILMLRNLWS